MSLVAQLADRLRTMFDNQPCERSLLAAQTIELLIDKKIHELRKELLSPEGARMETEVRHCEHGIPIGPSACPSCYSTANRGVNHD